MKKFKKGQLVQSVKYGSFYIVRQVQYDGTVVAVPLVVVRFNTLFFTPDRLRLVGNNYKPKVAK